MSTVRILRSNRFGKPVGYIDSQMTYGVHDTLVNRGIAEWIDKSPITSAAISVPVLSAPVETETTRERKPRRFSSKES